MRPSAGWAMSFDIDEMQPLGGLHIGEADAGSADLVPLHVALVIRDVDASNLGGLCVVNGLLRRFNVVWSGCLFLVNDLVVVTAGKAREQHDAQQSCDVSW